MLPVRFTLPVLLLLLVWTLPASAGTFFLEISEHASKEEAEAAVLTHGPDGEKMRVARRYVRGAGWRYVVRMDGFSERDKAVGAARNYATQERTILVYEGAGYKRTVIERVGGESSKMPAAAVAADAQDSGMPSASQVLKTAARAHGGRSGGSKLLAKAERLKFAFLSRTVVGDKEWKIRHHFYRFGERARVEVDMVKGDGVSNTIVVGDNGKAWVATKDLVRERDLSQASEMVARFAPETGLLSIPLGFANDIKAAAEWQGLTVSGQVSHRGKTHYRVVPDRRRGGDLNPMESALFNVETGRLVQVTWATRGGRVTFSYGDYRTVADDLVVPYSVRIDRNGGLVEAIEVSEFSVDPPLADTLFGEPTKIRGRKH